MARTFAAKNVMPLKEGHSAFGMGRKDTSADDYNQSGKENDILINCCKGSRLRTGVLETEEIC